MIDTSAVLAAVAGFGLAGTPTRPPGAPLEPWQWRDVVAGVSDQRLFGLLAQAIAEGDFAASDDQVEEAVRLEVEWATQALLLERKLVEVHTRWQRAGIDHVVLKGPALAHGLYRDPSLRCFADIDVLVPGASFDDALAVLVAVGARRRYDEPRPGFTGRFGKGASVVTPEGLEVDVHRSFVAGPLGQRIDVDSLFRRAVPFELAGQRLFRLAPEEAFLHACYHAVLGSAVPRLVPQRDLAELLLTTDPALDLDRVWCLSRAWRGDAVVARAVRQTWQSFALGDEHPMARWASAYRPSAAEERALAVSAGWERSFEGEAVATVAAIKGLGNKAAYLRAVALPDRAYVRRREGTYRRRWGHGLRLLLRRPRTR